MDVDFIKGRRYKVISVRRMGYSDLRDVLNGHTFIANASGYSCRPVFDDPAIQQINVRSSRPTGWKMFIKGCEPCDKEE